MHTAWNPNAAASEGESVCENRGGYPWGWNPRTLTSCRLDALSNGCVDVDGDSWGWDGQQSCIVGDNNKPIVDAPCVDADFDGWGWDGKQTCIVESAYNTSPCVDVDGDGWGWQSSILPQLPGRSCAVSRVTSTLNGSINGEAQVGSGVAIYKPGSANLLLRGFWGGLNNFRQVSIKLPATTGGTYQLGFEHRADLFHVVDGNNPALKLMRPYRGWLPLCGIKLLHGSLGTLSFSSKIQR